MISVTMYDNTTLSWCSILLHITNSVYKWGWQPTFNTVTTMAFCSRILGASISIIIFTATSVQPKSTVNSTQQHSNLLIHTSNHSTNIHKLQTANSIYHILNQYAVGKNDVRTKRSPNTNHNQHCHDHKLCFQPAVPTKSEEWINFISLLDYSNTTQQKQVSLQLI
mgnify:CR=1 FL=1